MQGITDLVTSLGLSHETIAFRLEEISRVAKKELGDIVLLEGRYEVRAEEARGMVPCPWGHPGGIFAKSHIFLRDINTGETIVWSDLSIHLIRHHGFYQGKGSLYRLEPQVLKDLFWGDSSKIEP